MLAPRPSISKLDAIERQLEAAIYLTLRKFSPEAVHTLMAASRGLLYGLHKNERNQFLATWDEKVLSRVLPGREKEWLFHQNKAANFLKHADRDPSASLEDVDLASLNHIELLICIMAFWPMRTPASPRLMLGFIYCGLLNETWLDLMAIFRDLGIPEPRLQYYRDLEQDHRREIMLAVFEKTLIQQTKDQYMI